jgi:hypothetical protein
MSAHFPSIVLIFYIVYNMIRFVVWLWNCSDIAAVLKFQCNIKIITNSFDRYNVSWRVVQHVISTQPAEDCIYMSVVWFKNAAHIASELMAAPNGQRFIGVIVCCPRFKRKSYPSQLVFYQTRPSRQWWMYDICTSIFNWLR